MLCSSRFRNTPDFYSYLNSKGLYGSPKSKILFLWTPCIAEGQLYLALYHHRMGLLRLGLVSECRITMITNDTTFSQTFFPYFKYKSRILHYTNICWCETEKMVADPKSCLYIFFAFFPSLLSSQWSQVWKWLSRSLLRVIHHRGHITPPLQQCTSPVSVTHPAMLSKLDFMLMYNI